MNDAAPLVAPPRWEGRQVHLLLPHYKTSNPRTSFAINSLYDRRRMAMALDFGDAFVAHSRNKLATNFLKTSLEWCCMIDDDNVPPFGNAAIYNSFTGFDLPEKFAGMNGIDRLLDHGKTLIGGVYRGRWPHGKPVFAEGNQLEDWVKDGPRDEIRPTKWIGFGFVLIHRRVFTDIEEKFPHLSRDANGGMGQWFTSSEHDLRNAVERALLLSDPVQIHQALEQGLRLSRQNSNLGVGEDVQFCRRALQAGHQTFIDLGCVVGHLGEFMYGYPARR